MISRLDFPRVVGVLCFSLVCSDTASTFSFSLSLKSLIMVSPYDPGADKGSRLVARTRPKAATFV